MLKVMKYFISILTALFVGSMLPALAQPTLAPSQKVDPKLLVTRIDVNCRVVQQSTKMKPNAEEPPPVHVVLRSGTWAVVQDADFAAADRTHASVMLVDVWKRAGNYTWILAHRYTQAGAQRATQACFRNDGSLARIRQATTLPGLDAASARAAYFNTDGSLIAKMGVVAM